MSEYVVIQNVDQGLGKIEVSYSVIDAIIRTLVDEDAAVFLDETRAIKTAPSIKLQDGTLVITLKVRIKYGNDVERSCAALQRELKQSLDLMIDYQDPEINISVVGFRFN